MADRDATLSENLFFVTNTLARKLSGLSDDAFSSFGLSTSHALILLLVYQDPEIQPSTLADSLYLKPSTITRLVQKLENRNLVIRNSKGRSTFIECTSKGENLAREIDKIWSELEDQKRDELGGRYVEVLSEMITNAIDTLEK